MNVGLDVPVLGLPGCRLGVPGWVPAGAILEGQMVSKGHSLGGLWCSMGQGLIGWATRGEGAWPKVLLGGCQPGSHYQDGWKWRV